MKRNVTISTEQQEFVKANHKKMNNAKIAAMLGISYSKLWNNIRTMGLVHEQAKVIDIGDRYFDVDKFGEYYRF